MTEGIDELNGINEAIKDFIAADGALETTAAASQIVAELAITTAVTATVRGSMSALRLGLAISGQIWKWEAISSLVGIGSGLTAGKIIDWVNKHDIGGWIYDRTHGDLFNSAQRFQGRYDPLTLDMDCDGLETVPLSARSPIKTGTGWVKGEDGFLALDRDGNGAIDSGRELFGDSTPLFDAEGHEIGKAEDGFDALAQEDSNHDGIVNDQDARWNDLRIWQDANQNGISEAGELKTMAAAGIASISVAKTEHSHILPGGNEIADLGTYSRTDGN
ncbi:MAG: hypothetical protein JZU63_04760, partial [Rhodoferax sp.]|nr:hypothetical protein [Rhodoferax sp.]